MIPHSLVADEQQFSNLAVRQTLRYMQKNFLFPLYSLNASQAISELLSIEAGTHFPPACTARIASQPTPRRSTLHETPWLLPERSEDVFRLMVVGQDYDRY